MTSTATTPTLKVSLEYQRYGAVILVLVPLEVSICVINVLITTLLRTRSIKECGNGEVAIRLILVEV